MTIDPMTIDAWIVATLQATSGATTVLNGVTVSADAVALVGNRVYPGRNDFEPAAWPFIVYSNRADVNFDNYAENLVLADGDWLIRMFSRQDQIPSGYSGYDVESFNRLGYIAIAAAFQGVTNPNVATGTVHGCSITKSYRNFYGEPGRMVSEMGVIAHITAS